LSTSGWEPQPDVRPRARRKTFLAAYATKIDELKARGGYVTADVIDVKPDTPNLDAMLLKFSSEHWHDEDEVRLIVEGRGLFHIHPPGGVVFAIEVEAAILIRVPKGTHHWFDLCGDRRFAPSDCSRISRAGRRTTRERRRRTLPAGLLRPGLLSGHDRPDV